MSGSGRKTLSAVWRCLGVVGRPSRRSESGREALPEVREFSGGPPGGPGLVGSGREVLKKLLEWSRGRPGGPVVVGMPSQWSGNGREALP